MAYLLDDDVFVRGNRQHYSFDFCPAFWDWIIAAFDDDKLCSVEMVRTEIAGDDELSKWAKDRDDVFLPFDKNDEPSQRRESEWAYS